MLKKTLFSGLLLLTMLLGYSAYAKVRDYLRIIDAQQTAENKWIRARLVQLQGLQGGSCTGFSVKSPKGKIYTVTAAHCSDLLFNQQAAAVDENGVQSILTVVAVSQTSDIMLLTSWSKKYFKIAKRVRQHERVHTIAYSDGKPSQRSDGEIICWAGPIDYEASAPPECNTDRVESATSDTFAVSTLKILHGASGGPLLNSKNEVVGANNLIDYKGYVYHALLRDIKEILKDK